MEDLDADANEKKDCQNGRFFFQGIVVLKYEPVESKFNSIHDVQDYEADEDEGNVD